MSKIKIDGEDLIMALQSSPYDETRWFLNEETGDVAMTGDGSFDGEDFEDDEDLKDKLAEGNYIEIDPLPSHDAYRIMEDFIETLAAGQPRSRLTDALGGKGAFRRFKDRLYDYPQLQERYFRFHELAYRQFVLDWLKENEIDAEVTFRDLPPMANESVASRSKPAEELVAEIPCSNEAIPDSICRVVVRRSKSGARVHLEAWSGGTIMDKGVVFAPDELHELIETLETAQIVVAKG